MEKRIAANRKSDILHRAVERKNYRQFCLLVNSGYSLNSRDKSGLTVLMKCCTIENNKWRATAVQSLLQHDAKVNITDGAGNTALFYAVRKSRENAVRLLLDDVDINLSQVNQEGNTVLHYAATAGHVPIMRMLIANARMTHVSVDPVSADGYTPLHLACIHGHIEIARRLIRDGGASLSIRDDVHFRNAQEMMEEKHPNATAAISDIFTQNPEAVRFNAQNYRPRERAWSATTARSTSVASSTSQPSMSPSSRPNTAYSRLAGSSDMSTSEKDSLRSLFKLYSNQSSQSFRVSAKPPPAPPPDLRSKMQKVVKMKKMTSILEKLTGRKRASLKVSMLEAGEHRGSSSARTTSRSEPCSAVTALGASPLNAGDGSSTPALFQKVLRSNMLRRRTLSAGCQPSYRHRGSILEMGMEKSTTAACETPSNGHLSRKSIS